jgi:hypothetical protein
LKENQSKKRNRKLADDLLEYPQDYVNDFKLYYNAPNRKRMPDGTLKLTKVSKSIGDIPKPISEKIRTKQLQVTQEYFNKMK